jgi:hypothetical protein
MKVDFKLEGVDSTKKLLKLYEKHVGKGVADGVKEMANSSARSLAMRVQPYGLSERVGQRFIDNIYRQIRFVGYAVRTGQAYGATSIEDAHKKMRRNGKVRIARIRKASVENDVSWEEIQQYTKKQTGKAGRAKAGWLDCAMKLDGKLSGVGGWIKRHVNGNWGAVWGVGTKTITMVNQTPYLTGPQKDKDVRYALAQGRKNGLKFVAKQIRGAIKKAEREGKRSIIRAEKASIRASIKAEKAWDNRFKLPPRTR